MPKDYFSLGISVVNVPFSNHNLLTNLLPSSSQFVFWPTIVQHNEQLTLWSMNCSFLSFLGLTQPWITPISFLYISVSLWSTAVRGQISVKSWLSENSGTAMSSCLHIAHPSLPCWGSLLVVSSWWLFEGPLSFSPILPPPQRIEPPI